jgi:hypothetical protein
MPQTNSVPQGLFGPGILILTRTDVANATPVNVGFCNEFSYDMTADVKELYGQNRLPLLDRRRHHEMHRQGQGRDLFRPGP